MWWKVGKALSIKEKDKMARLKFRTSFQYKRVKRQEDICNKRERHIQNIRKKTQKLKKKTNKHINKRLE